MAPFQICVHRVLPLLAGIRASRRCAYLSEHWRAVLPGGPAVRPSFVPGYAATQRLQMKAVDMPEGSTLLRIEGLNSQPQRHSGRGAGTSGITLG